MDLIGASNWAKFKAVMRNAHDTFNQDIITWRRWVEGTTQLYNEEPSGTFVEINLKVLMFYNTFRTWPITQKEVSGEIDNQNTVVMINREYLGELGYLTAEGQMDYQPDKDYFYHRGKVYKPEGDTLVSQAHNDPLHIYLILRVQEGMTGT